MQNRTSASGALETVGLRIDRMPFTRWHARMLATLGCSHFMDGFDVTALAFVLPVLVHLWHLSPGQVGILIAASAIGQAFGAVTIGFWAERHGRLKALQAGLAIMGVFSLACAFAPGFAVLFGLRLLQGVGFGGEAPVAATYVSEMSPARLRGRMVMGIQLLFAIGTATSPIVARLLIPHFGWRSMFIVGVFPVILAAVLRRLLPESPLWQAANASGVAAETTLQRIEQAVFRGRAAPDEPMVTDGVATDREPRPAGGTGGRIGLLFGGTLTAPTLSAWLLAFTGNLVGYALIVWMPTLYRTVYHLSLARSLSYSAIAGTVSLLGAVACLLLIDPLGRKASLSLSCLGSALCLAGLAAGGASMSPGYVASLATVALGFAAFPLAGIYAYIPELYPTQSRAFGMGVASAWGRIATIAGPLAIGLILTVGSVSVVYIFLAVTTAVGGIGLALFGRETRPRPT